MTTTTLPNFEVETYTLKDILTKLPIEELRLTIEDGYYDPSTLELTYKTDEDYDTYQELRDSDQCCLEDDLSQYIDDNKYELFLDTFNDNHSGLYRMETKFYLHEGKVYHDSELLVEVITHGEFN